jgi:hypothetical protein
MDPTFDGDTSRDHEARWSDDGSWWVPDGTPRCPDGNPQRLLEILGFRLTAPDRLQLRAVLYPGEGGCLPVIDERSDCVRVRLVACWDPDETLPRHSLADPRGTNCGFRSWLDEPLGPRPVIDLDTGEELALYLPGWHLDKPCRYVPRPPGDVWPGWDVDTYETRGA